MKNNDKKPTNSRGRNNKPRNCKPKDNRGRKESGYQGTDYEPKTNDPGFYFNDAQILKDAASIPFAAVAGLPWTITQDSIYGMKVGGDSFVVPGFMVQYIRPSLPVTYKTSDPVNTAFAREFAFLRYTISASLPYETPDLAMLTLAMGDIYAYINWMQRIYGLSFMYTQQNRYLPKTLIQAQGIDPDTIDLAKFRYGINLLINKAASLAVPAKVKYFARRASIFANIYTGGTSLKDQLYIYAPAGFWMYGEGEEAPGNLPGLVYKPWLDELNPLNSPKTYQDALDYGTEMLDRVLSSQSIGIMTSNILRAYGDAGVIKLATLPENYLLNITFDIGVLEQMRNADVLPYSFVQQVDATTAKMNSNNMNWSVYQVVNNTGNPATSIQFAPGVEQAQDTDADKATWSQFEVFGSVSRILTTTTQYTGPELVVESSRLMQYLVYNPSIPTTSDGIWVAYTGSESVTSCMLFTNEVTSGNELVLRAYFAGSVTMRETEQAATIEPVTYADIRRECVASSFRFRPGEWYAWYTNVGANFMQVNSLNYMGDIDNYAIIDITELRQLNEMAAMSLFEVPGVAKAY